MQQGRNARTLVQSYLPEQRDRIAALGRKAEASLRSAYRHRSRSQSHEHYRDNAAQHIRSVYRHIKTKLAGDFPRAYDYSVRRACALQLRLGQLQRGFVGCAVNLK